MSAAARSNPGVAPDPIELRRRAEATLDHYFALSGSVVVHRLGRFLFEPSRPQVWDANHLRRPRAATPDQIDELLAALDQTYAGMGHRQVVTDLDTPDPLEARLALMSWTLDTVIQHVLVGPLRLDRVHTTAPDRLELHPATTDQDWASMAALTRADHLEEATKEGREPWSESLTQQMVDHRREKGPEVQAWLARIDGLDVGMFSALPGSPESLASTESSSAAEDDPDLAGPVGLVEDLFVDPGWRGQGISVALIERCVDDARRREAGPVIIGSEPADWPKGLYARLGFTPLWVQHWWRRPGPTEAGADQSA